MKKYYQIIHETGSRSAEIYIYGAITADAELLDAIFETETGAKSARGILAEIEGLDVDEINVYINSYGGEVAEALAIYAALKRHPAQVHTFCDGFACSAASVIFVAGTQRTMGPLSLLMIHNASTRPTRGTAEELRKAAEDLEKITDSSVTAYAAVCPELTRDEIKALMDRETWIDAEEAVKYGFATDVAEAADDDEEDNPEQSAFACVREAVLMGRDTATMIERYEKLQDAIVSLAITVAGMKDAKEKEQSKAKPEPQPEEQPEEKPAAKTNSFFGRYIKRL